MRVIRIWMLVSMVLGGSAFGAGADARQTPVVSGEPRCIAKTEIDANIGGVVDGVIVSHDSYAMEVNAFSVETCDEVWTYSDEDYQVLDTRTTDGLVIVRTMSLEQIEGMYSESDDFTTPIVRVLALEPQSGAEIWARDYDLGFSISQYQVTPEYLILDGLGGVVVANVATGEPIWEARDFDSYIVTSAFVNDQVLVRYEVDSQGEAGTTFHAYELKTGAPRWQFDAGEASSFPQVFSADADGDVLVLSTVSDVSDVPTGNMTAVNATTGNLLWTVEAFPGSSSVELGGVVVANASDSVSTVAIVVLDVETGEELHRVPTSGLVTAVARRGNIVVLVIENSEQGVITTSGFDIASGKEVWRHELAGGIAWGGAWISDGTELLVATDSYLFVLDQITGAIKLQSDLPDLDYDYSVSETDWCPDQLLGGSIAVTEQEIAIASCSNHIAIFDRR